MVPDVSSWWFVVAAAVAFFVNPTSDFKLRRDGLFGLTLALMVLSASLWVWLKQGSSAAPAKAAIVYHLPESGVVEEREVVTTSLQIRDRSHLNQLAGRRRVTALEVVGYLRVPGSGLHRFHADCVARCTLRVGNETVLDGPGSTSGAIELEASMQRFWLRYERGGVPAQLKLSWDRPALVELLPLDAYVSGDVGLLSDEARSRRELSSALWVLQAAAWWLGVFCLVLWSGGKARGRFAVDRGPDGEPLRDGTRLALRAWLFAVGLNLPFLLFHPGWTLVEIPLLRSLAVNGVLFLVPGLPIAGAIFGPGKPLAVLVWSLTCSFGIFVAIVTGFQVFSVPLTSVGAWNTTWVLTNIGLLVYVLSTKAAARAKSIEAGRLWGGSSLFLVAYLLYYFGATVVVPPQTDHDLEVQGTGFGLLTRSEPLLLTDRGTFYYFAHPPLLHYYVGGAFLYFNQLEHLAYYDAASQRALAASRGEPFTAPTELGEREIVRVEGSDYVVNPPFEDGSEQIPVELLELNQIYRHYETGPHRLATRAPTIFLAAITVAIIAVWARGLVPVWIAILVGLSYATSPEVFVRSSYGGYFAVSNFSLLMMLLTWDAWSGRRRAASFATCLAAAFLAALANHKLVLLPAAVLIWELVRSARTPKRENLYRIVFNPVIVGFTLGYAAFWAHGLVVNFEAFWLDHVRTHLADRLTHNNPLGYGGYPSPFGLWIEFWRHRGYALLPLGVVALVLGTRDKLGRGSGSSMSLWLIWAALTAIVFSLVDWRMTKHLMPLMLPLHLAPVAWAGARARRVRLVAAMFVAILAWNVWTIHSLVTDFDAFPITPQW